MVHSGEAAANVLLRACGCGRVTATSGDAADSSLQGFLMILRKIRKKQNYIKNTYKIIKK